MICAKPNWISMTAQTWPIADLWCSYWQNNLHLSSVCSDVLTPHYPWQSSDVSVGMLPPHHSNDFGLEPPGHNKENEDDVEAMSTDSSSSSSDSDWKTVCVCLRGHHRSNTHTFGHFKSSLVHDSYMGNTWKDNNEAQVHFKTHLLQMKSTLHDGLVVKLLVNICLLRRGSGVFIQRAAVQKLICKV